MKAIKERYNGILFDSRLECHAYRILCSIYGQNSVKPQYELSLLSSKGYWIPLITHKIDFAIVDNAGGIIHLIEVKGTIHTTFSGKSEYLRTLELLFCKYPELMEKYTIWVGDKVTAFKFGAKRVPFAIPFPSSIESARNLLLI